MQQQVRTNSPAAVYAFFNPELSGVLSAQVSHLFQQTSTASNPKSDLVRAPMSSIREGVASNAALPPESSLISRGLQQSIYLHSAPLDKDLTSLSKRHSVGQLQCPPPALYILNTGSAGAKNRPSAPGRTPSSRVPGLHVSNTKSLRPKAFFPTTPSGLTSTLETEPALAIAEDSETSFAGSFAAPADRCSAPAYQASPNASTTPAPRPRSQAHISGILLPRGRHGERCGTANTNDRDLHRRSMFADGGGGGDDAKVCAPTRSLTRSSLRSGAQIAGKSARCRGGESGLRPLESLDGALASRAASVSRIVLSMSSSEDITTTACVECPTLLPLLAPAPPPVTCRRGGVRVFFTHLARCFGGQNSVAVQQ